ncbi:DNA-processing protein DprA [Leptospira biflexa]|uniref:DNA-processing protein DprA n=1 Tax=Leptospira biflexa TaxID=172 RepID=UPI0010833771|nr:DNA-processing protein DprA [Leptospira biflexa]TGM41427.1 DNA-processing protein DprA [Leptospira biflexa]TGM47631.1 DNA-processing protein DprA [Leptospira biflexa]TGM49903.1 DNA-processing protein DprA [Leptospira biflexa]
MVVSILGHPKVTSYLRKTKIWRSYNSFPNLYNDLPKFFVKEDWERWLYECQIWEKNKDPNWQLVHFYDESYPQLLKEIYDPPLVLVCLGDLSVFQRELVAIVGTRKSSPISLVATKALVQSLAKKEKMAIVSGLALGIDRQAFVSALDLGVPVLGVLGTTLGMEYPPGNRDLYKRIKSDTKQLLISEFLMQTEPAKWTFPKRNRVISGLCQKVYILESGKKSGTISTATSAMEQNREIFVFDHPHQFDNEGGKMLLRQGAGLLTGEMTEPSKQWIEKKILSYEEWRKQKSTNFLSKKEEVEVDFRFIL